VNDDLPPTAPAIQIDLREALTRFSGPEGERSIAFFRHGSLMVKLYAPRMNDSQTPHSRDEIYVVAQGRGVFHDGETRRPFEPGTFVFVKAGRPHRFEDFTNDFAVWVFFYGPEGGEGDLLVEEEPEIMGSAAPGEGAGPR
jgi:mannose-6-phosphate isomerase-like protein (cupin superfamily)